jgi:hypothetical protein
MFSSVSIKIRKRLATYLGSLLIASVALSCFNLTMRAEAQDEKLRINASFSDKDFLSENERIELRLNRPLSENEGALAVLIGDTDFTALFDAGPAALVYKPKVMPLPLGETKLTVYLVSPNGGWAKLEEFTLRVKENDDEISGPQTTAQANGATSTTTKEDTKTSAASSIAEKQLSGETKYEFTPSLTLNLKSQQTVLFFPDDAPSERANFFDFAGQGNFQLKVERAGWSWQNQFDFAGSSVQNEALRFGELGDRAPRVDLSSYMVQMQKGKMKLAMGHVSFGSNRHLINNFSSRGLTLTVPIGKQNEFSVAAANGTSIVGFGNFLGLNRRKHQHFSGTFAREFFKERPDGLRFEASALHGSLLPLNNFNQGVVNDAERSVGYSFRVVGSDKSQRLRFEGGFTRSRFVNPSDPFLEQGLDVTPIRARSRNARYLEVSFDFFQSLKLSETRQLKLTGTYRHEQVDPLFRSVAASTQADRVQNQIELSGNIGDISLAFSHARDNDNLNNIPSILKANTRRNNFIAGVATGTLFSNPAKPSVWLPRLSYSLDRTHQFGTSFPVNGEFRDASQIPDQVSFNQSFAAEWQISQRFRFGYRFNRSFQDNRQQGRETSDLLNIVHSWNIGLNPHSALDLNFDLSAESANNKETSRIDDTLRVGSSLTWRMSFPKNSVLTANISTTIAGDRTNTNDSRNAEFDIQWAYKFGVEKSRFRKVQTQFFIRYSNRYSFSQDNVFIVRNLNKLQTFNAGLTFTFF